MSENARTVTTAVGGEFGVTATLPTLADVIAFKEGTAPFDRGYYRYVPHPRLREMEDLLRSRFGCRHCRLSESPESALLELLLTLHTPGSRTGIRALQAEATGASFTGLGILPVVERQEFALLPEGAPMGRGDILLLCCNKGERLAPSCLEEARRAGDAGAAVVALFSETPDRPPVIPGTRYWITALPGGRGAAVLGLSDKVMGRLAERMRRRGPWLSPREVASPQAPTVDGACARVCEELCRLEGGTSALLYPSGMSAITRVLDVVRSPGRSQIVAVGHLFSDTFEGLRQAPRLPGEEPNRFLGVDEMDELPGALSSQTAAILTETITNPLNDVPDIPLLAKAARERGIPLIVDNTIATPLSCGPLSLGADIVVHSTTKYLNGANDHGGGALVFGNPALARALEELQKILHDAMSPLEAAVLEKRMASFPERMKRFNENARRVAGFLATHPGVKRLYFNGHPSHRCHATARRILAGTSSVISFTLTRDTLGGLRAFYDAPLSAVIKAPSLGSDRTLLCPYTILTHYNATDEELESVGLPRYLLRLSVGSEPDIAPVIESLRDALGQV